MTEPTRETHVKKPGDADENRGPDVVIQPLPVSSEWKVPTQKGAVDDFLKRNEEVLEKDREEFQAYLVAKEEQADAEGEGRRGGAQSKRGISRRTMLSPPPARPSSPKPACSATTCWAAARHRTTASTMAAGTGAQQSPIVREVVDSRADIKGRSLGNWVALLPTKMGGGTYAIDLNSNRVLASIWYWNYGDYNPISHHLCAFPSADPYHGFEFVNSTQGGQNSLIYGIPTSVTAENAPGGTNIYRVRYDGTQMQMIENVSETTGLGLGVHVTVNPKDAQSYFVTDGQKDIAACFDRTTSKVKAALKFDWTPNVPDLRDAWIKGGTLTIKKIYPDQKTGLYDYRGTKGNKIDWEMVPMGELFVEEGSLPGDERRWRSTGADGTIWHPEGRWAATVVRLCGGIPILDPEKNFEPAAFLQFNKDLAGPVQGRADRQGHLAGRVRQDPFAGPRDRLLARRQVPRDDEQSAGKQLLDLLLHRSRPDQVAQGRPCRGSAVARRVSRTRSTWCSRWTARSSICPSCIPRRPIAASW